MLMVAPTGSTKRVILLSILLFSSRHLKVTGSVAELQDSREEEDFKASTETEKSVSDTLLYQTTATEQHQHTLQQHVN